MIPANTRSNNFDLLRLFFAICVIISHSFVLSGFPDQEPLSRLTNGQVIFSYIGLRGFFIISGFLIYQSFVRSGSVLDFMWKRFLRIFPGLITISILTVFIIGPVISTLHIADYFTQRNTYLVFSQSVDLFFERNIHTLPGVFEKNIYAPEINGSLWTISYEFLFYFGFLVLFLLKNKKLVLIALATAIIGMLIIKIRWLDPWFKYEYFIANSEIGVKALFDFGLFFIIGAFFACINYDKVRANYIKIVFYSLLLIISTLIYFQQFNFLTSLLLIPLILSLGLMKPGKFDFTKKTGDISYGIYLSGFFIQQCFMSIYPFSPYQLLVLSLTVCIIYGILSWRYIEKPALMKKNKFKNLRLAREKNLSNYPQL